MTNSNILSIPQQGNKNVQSNNNILFSSWATMLDSNTGGHMACNRKYMMD
jgi:hypothetical protein